MTKDDYRVEDRLAIQELVHRYSIFVDTKQIAPLMALFAREVIFDESVLGPESGPFNGIDEVRGYFERSFPVTDSMMHVSSNLIIDFVDQSTAKGVSTLLFEGAVWDGSARRIRGYFYDEFVMEGSAWKFKHRKLELMSPMQELVQPL